MNNSTNSDSLEGYYFKNSTYTESEIEDAKEAILIHEFLILMVLLVLSKFGSAVFKRRLNFLNESLFSVIIGFIGGFITLFLNKPDYVNNITQGYLKIFIIFLLPPIIFESAYNIKKKEFYKNLGTILLYAILGTLISILFIGYFTWKLGILNYYKGFTFQESLAYGALISATDPVCILAAFKQYTTDSNFFLLVFGESILNDAVSMVFYDSVAEYTGGGSTFNKFFYPMINFFVILIGSTIVGMLIGFIASIILKIQKNNFRIEIGLMLTLPWFSYLICHVCGLSAIVVIFFIGISFHIYAKPYISEHSEEIIHSVYEEIVNIAESLVFVFIGISFFADHPYKDVNLSLPITLILLCLVGRLLNIGICSYLANMNRLEDSKITLKKQFFLWFSGVRGAMAFALALKSKFDFPGVGSMFLLLTLFITAFTLIYSSFFLEKTLQECEIIVLNEEVNANKETAIVDNQFERIKSLIYNFHMNYLLPYVIRTHNEEGNNTLMYKLNNDFTRD